MPPNQQRQSTEGTKYKYGNVDDINWTCAIRGYCKIFNSSQASKKASVILNCTNRKRGLLSKKLRQNSIPVRHFHHVFLSVHLQPDRVLLISA